MLGQRRRLWSNIITAHPLSVRRCCDVESTSMTLIQRRNCVVCPVGRLNVSVFVHYLAVGYSGATGLQQDHLPRQSSDPSGGNPA